LTSQREKPYRLLINVADFIVAVDTSSTEVAQRLQRRYKDFLGTNEMPHLTIGLETVPGALYLEPRPGPWAIETSYHDNQLTYRSYQEKGEVDLIRRVGQFEMDPGANIENVLRAVYAWLCVQESALLLHAAGVIRDGNGFVFFGPSGSGKTTTSRLAAKTATVVSDDIVIVRCHEGGCMLYGVPFRGEMSEAPRTNQRAPLRGVFRLRQDTTHFIEPISKVNAIADLVAASPFVVGEPSLSDRLFSVCQQIAEKVPVRQLHFKRDDGFWKVINGYTKEIPETAPSHGR
jgi:hypothetical protein